MDRRRSHRRNSGHGPGERLADGLAARSGLAPLAGDLALTVLAWSETTGTERIVLSIEKRLSGLMAALFGRWTVLGALGGEEISPGVMSMTLASRVDEDGKLSELVVELVRTSSRRSWWRSIFQFGGFDAELELRWSVVRAPAEDTADAPEDSTKNSAENLAVVDDWPDARQALIDWWASA